MFWTKGQKKSYTLTFTSFSHNSFEGDSKFIETQIFSARIMEKPFFVSWLLYISSTSRISNSFPWLKSFLQTFRTLLIKKDFFPALPRNIWTSLKKTICLQKEVYKTFCTKRRQQFCFFLEINIPLMSSTLVGNTRNISDDGNGVCKYTPILACGFCFRRKLGHNIKW